MIEPAKFANKKPKILIVDDEIHIRNSLSAYLEDLEMDTYTASSGEEALALIEGNMALEKMFDLAIVDLRLPGISGEIFIVRAHNIDPQLLFIVHTGSTTYRPNVELMTIGIKPEQVLIKPIHDLNLLGQKIIYFLEKGSSPCQNKGK